MPTIRILNMVGNLVGLSILAPSNKIKDNFYNILKLILITIFYSYLSVHILQGSDHLTGTRSEIFNAAMKYLTFSSLMMILCSTFLSFFDRKLMWEILLEIEKIDFEVMYFLFLFILMVFFFKYLSLFQLKSIGIFQNDRDRVHMGQVYIVLCYVLMTIEMSVYYIYLTDAGSAYEYTKYVYVISMTFLSISFTTIKILIQVLVATIYFRYKALNNFLV